MWVVWMDVMLVDDWVVHWVDWLVVPMVAYLVVK